MPGRPPKPRTLTFEQKNQKHSKELLKKYWANG
jgi:hypothetical protein